VSDLHAGAREAHLEAAVASALAELVERLRPELVIASGDLTNRGRRGQHQQAAD